MQIAKTEIVAISMRRMEQILFAQSVSFTENVNTWQCKWLRLRKIVWLTKVGSINLTSVIIWWYIILQ